MNNYLYNIQDIFQFDRNNLSDLDSSCLISLEQLFFDKLVIYSTEDIKNEFIHTEFIADEYRELLIIVRDEMNIRGIPTQNYHFKEDPNLFR